MVLTDVKVKNSKPKEKPYKIYDEKGLYMIVTPKAGRWWRLDYSFNGKRKTISLGTYPLISIKEARDKRDEIKKLIKEGIDPSKKKKEDNSPLFKDIAWEWFESKKQSWTERHTKTVRERIKNYVEPLLGEKRIVEISLPEIFDALSQVQNKGYIELARRLKQIMSMIFDYAIMKGIIIINPAASLAKGIFGTKKVNHYPTILQKEEIGALMRAIDGYEYLLVRCALKFLALTFVRPGELRYAEWKDINFEEKTWQIPAEKMKMKKEHLVPLSRQAVETLETIKPFSGTFKYVFPSVRDKNRPISDVTLNAALRRMGYDTKKDITGHGFRAMARTILHEKLKYSPDIIELQLAHAVPDRLGEAYNRTKFSKERKKMMQDWADYLDKLKSVVG